MSRPDLELAWRNAYDACAEKVQRLTEELRTLKSSLEATAADRDTFQKWALKSDAERDALQKQLAEAQFQAKFNAGYIDTLKQLGFHGRFLEDYQAQKMKIRKLEAALQQYADPQRWKCLRCLQAGTVHHALPHEAAIFEDGPDLAKAALGLGEK